MRTAPLAVSARVRGASLCSALSVPVSARASLCAVQIDHDLLNPPAEFESKQHKLNRLVQAPNSFFMDVKVRGMKLHSLARRAPRATAGT